MTKGAISVKKKLRLSQSPDPRDKIQWRPRSLCEWNCSKTWMSHHPSTYFLGMSVILHGLILKQNKVMLCHQQIYPKNVSHNFLGPLQDQTRNFLSNNKIISHTGINKKDHLVPKYCFPDLQQKFDILSNLFASRTAVSVAPLWHLWTNSFSPASEYNFINLWP